MECNTIEKPSKAIDDCKGYQIRDTCVLITNSVPELDIYKGDNLNEAILKIIKYITKDEL